MLTADNLTAYTDDNLDALRLLVLNEQERRAKLAQIPATVGQLAEQYVSAGGDASALTEAIASA